MFRSQTVSLGRKEMVIEGAARAPSTLQRMNGLGAETSSVKLRSEALKDHSLPTGDIDFVAGAGSRPKEFSRGGDV